MTQDAFAPESLGQEAEQRSRIVKRLMFAALLVGLLLGLLAFFDYLSTTEEAEVPEFTEPVPVAPTGS